jgi:hypothetical protein
MKACPDSLTGLAQSDRECCGFIQLLVNKLQDHKPMLQVPTASSLMLVRNVNEQTKLKHVT